MASDGGYLIVGNTRSDDGDVTMNHGATDLWAVKMDSEQLHPITA